MLVAPLERARTTVRLMPRTWRLIPLVFGLVLLPALPARADVFVPADPTGVGDALCAAGERDVLAVGGGTTTRVQVGGGPFSELAGMSGCPVVAVAQDGTAAVLDGDGRLALRRPGGTFAAPSPLTDPDSAPEGAAIA